MEILLTEEILRKIMPFAKEKNIKRFLPELNQSCEIYGINTPVRVQAFIAQIAHESGSLNYVKEIASGQAYEGRADLGNLSPGDGVRYKGRGLIQLTGKANYAELSKAFGVNFILSPELLEIPEWAARSAAWFWKKRKLNELADKDMFRSITVRINGGLNGLKDRYEFYKLAKKHIPTPPDLPISVPPSLT